MLRISRKMRFRPLLLALAAMGVLGAFTAQAEGVRQSPINVQPAKAVKARAASPISAHFANDATLDVVNTYNTAGTVKQEWATLKANVPAGSSISVDGVKYNLLQFHFHTPSEHAVNGKRTAMEVHFVFLRDAAAPCGRNPDALMVIGARIVAGAHNAELGKIFDSASLPANSAAPHLAVAHFDVGNVLGSLSSSWRYSGSLTAPASFAPTCDEPEGTVAHQLEADDLPENVSWVVLSHTIAISAEQIATFKKLFPEGNSREAMPLKGRKVTVYK